MKSAAECSIEGCARTVVARGWCGAHYQQWAKGNKRAGIVVPSLTGKWKRPPKQECSIEGCSNFTYGHGWCQKHYGRFWRHGNPTTLVRSTHGSKRRINAQGYVEIWEPTHPLAMKHGYVTEHRKVAWDEGLLLDARFHVHHLNHIKTDNRITNLVVVTHSEHRHKFHREPVQNQFGVWPILKGEARERRKKELRRKQYLSTRVRHRYYAQKCRSV